MANNEERVDPDIFKDEKDGHELGQMINEEKARLLKEETEGKEKPQ